MNLKVDFVQLPPLQIALIPETVSLEYLLEVVYADPVTATLPPRFLLASGII